MKLNLKNIQEYQQFWNDKGYILPTYDLNRIKQNTKEKVEWIHFGGGNLFRAYHARLADLLIQKGLMDTGIVVVEGYDEEIIDLYKQNDMLALAVTLRSDGKIDKEVLGSVVEGIKLNFGIDEINTLKHYFSQPFLKMATFTITEKGYALKDTKGNIIETIASDYQNGPVSPKSYLGKVSSLLIERYKNGAYPIALVSTDNCSHNGDKLKIAINSFIDAWIENGFVDCQMKTYINTKVSFPITMIDKITPRPDTKVEEILIADGLEDVSPKITDKNTYVAPFVNAEETEYLVIEDLFPNGKLPLDKVGAIYTIGEMVDKVEVMKVGTCLNPLHTALAIFGCLLGHTLISKEMEDEDLVALIQQLGYKEGMKVVEDPGIINPKEFIDTCINIRFPNPFMPDTPQRIATDTSQKLSVRYGTTLTRYIERNLDLGELKAIPLIYAGWIRYLMGINDDLESFTLSPDPLFKEVLPYVEGLNENNVEEKIEPLLHNKNIFKYDLYEIGLANQVIENVKGMLQGKGSIRATIQRGLK